jgi:hypothetical protein
MTTHNTNSTGQAAQYQPEFINHHQATAIFGLSRSHLYQLVQSGKIKSVSLRERNKIKGKRLFIADSIREFLTANIEEDMAQS